MEFIIIAVLTTTLAVYSWYVGYKLGERKGWNQGQQDMEDAIKQYLYHHNAGGKPCEKENTQ